MHLVVAPKIVRVLLLTSLELVLGQHCVIFAQRALIASVKPGFDAICVEDVLLAARKAHEQVALRHWNHADGALLVNALNLLEGKLNLDNVFILDDRELDFDMQPLLKVAEQHLVMSKDNNHQRS